MFWLFDTKNPAFIALALSVGMVFFAMMYGPMAAFFSELFGTRMRYSGASVSYSLGGILGAALAPTIATQLLSATGTSLSISLYIAIMALITFVCTFLLSETYLTDLSSIRSEERRLIAEGSTTGEHKTSR
jgi:MFS family permease